MNTVNAIAASSLLPLPSTEITQPVQSASSCRASSCCDASRFRDQVTWSPGLWWLLHRYEYLFEGMLPTNHMCHQIVKLEHNGITEESGLETARPHWGESRLLNAPPAAGTLPATPLDIPVSQPVECDQPVVGSFVDLVA